MGLQGLGKRRHGRRHLPWPARQAMRGDGWHGHARGYQEVRQGLLWSLARSFGRRDLGADRGQPQQLMEIIEPKFLS